ncbi:hypothetical protein HK096_003801 [Nowakowskiella sp. JEL0078]|nr:hypothetical protein HK096_003801 [Nowakowskiella sp. JEL0078]
MFQKLLIRYLIAVALSIFNLHFVVAADPATLVPSSIDANGVVPFTEISFCKSQNLAPSNGSQNRQGACSSTPQGSIPSFDRMVSTLIIQPDYESTLDASQNNTVTVAIQNLQTGFFDDPQKQYYLVPQTLNIVGNVEGHLHITVQKLSGKSVLDARVFSFFKGLNAASTDGLTLSVIIPAGTLKENGAYRFCSITGTFSHQPVIMPVAQRGAQDDCVRVSVKNAGVVSAPPSTTTTTTTTTTATTTTAAAAATIIKSTTASTSSGSVDIAKIDSLIEKAISILAVGLKSDATTTGDVKAAEVNTQGIVITTTKSTGIKDVTTTKKVAGALSSTKNSKKSIKTKSAKNKDTKTKEAKTKVIKTKTTILNAATNVVSENDTNGNSGDIGSNSNAVTTGNTNTGSKTTLDIGKFDALIESAISILGGTVDFTYTTTTNVDSDTTSDSVTTADASKSDTTTADSTITDNSEIPITTTAATLSTTESAAIATNVAASGIFFSEDFESLNSVSDSPNWKIQSSGAVASIDTTNPKNGKKALRLKVKGNGFGFLVPNTFAPPSNSFFGRINLFVANFPKQPDFAHFINVEAKGTGDTSLVRPIGGQFIPGETTEFGPGSDLGPTGDWTNHQKTVPTTDGVYTCLEWQMRDSDSLIQLFVNGVEKKELQVSKNIHGGNQVDFIFPKFNNIRIGWQEFQSTSDNFDVFIDDIALGTSRIGC